MGFTKTDYAPEIAIEVRHQWHPDVTFTFHFPKVLPQAAVEAEREFLGLSDAEREAESRHALINIIAQMLVREPEGFDDFPSSSALPTSLVARSLPERVRTYFNDTEKPELEAILVSVWRAYRAAAISSAYLKSIQNNGARSRGVPRATAEDSSAV